HDLPLQRRTLFGAERQRLDHLVIDGKQVVATRFKAVCFDGGEQEDAVFGTVFSRAEITRNQQAALSVQLFLVGREKHAQSHRARWPVPDASGRRAKGTPYSRLSQL